MRLPQFGGDGRTRTALDRLAELPVFHLRIEKEQPADPLAIIAVEGLGGKGGGPRLVEQAAGGLGELAVLAARLADHVLRTAEPHGPGKQRQHSHQRRLNGRPAPGAGQHELDDRHRRNVMLGETEMELVEGHPARVSSRHFPDQVGQQQPVVALADADIRERILVGQGDDRAVAGLDVKSDRSLRVLPEDPWRGVFQVSAAWRLGIESPAIGHGKFRNSRHERVARFDLPQRRRALGGRKGLGRLRRLGRRRSSRTSRPETRRARVRHASLRSTCFAGHQDQGVPLVDPVLQGGDFFAGQPLVGPQDEQDADSPQATRLKCGGGGA